MTAPTFHTLTVILRDGKHVRARVVYVQPKAQRWQQQTTQVHIHCSE